MGGANGHDVGIGAILGAPFMLGTLAIFVTGVSVFVFRTRREQGTNVECTVPNQKRDLRFFLIAYFIAVITSFLPIGNIRAAIAPFFILIYLVYLVRMFTANDSCGETVLDPLTLHVLSAKLRNSTVNEGGNPPLWHTVVQVALSLVLIVGGARLFVNQIVNLAESLHLDAILLSLIVAPVATELPEKLNSVLWVRQGKDTLALGTSPALWSFKAASRWHLALPSRRGLSGDLRL